MPPMRRLACLVVFAACHSSPAPAPLHGRCSPAASRPFDSGTIALEACVPSGVAQLVVRGDDSALLGTEPIANASDTTLVGVLTANGHSVAITLVHMTGKGSPDPVHGMDEVRAWAMVEGQLTSVWDVMETHLDPLLAADTLTVMEVTYRWDGENLVRVEKLGDSGYPGDWNICGNVGIVDFEPGTTAEIVGCTDEPYDDSKAPAPQRHHAHLVLRKGDAIATSLDLRDYDSGEYGGHYVFDGVITAHGHSAVLVGLGGFGTSDLTAYALDGGEWKAVYNLTGGDIQLDIQGDAVTFDVCQGCNCMGANSMCDPAEQPMHQRTTLHWDGHALK